MPAGDREFRSGIKGDLLSKGHMRCMEKNCLCRFPPDWKGIKFHHIKWVCRDVYHCAETGVEIERRWVSGRLPRVCWILFVATMAGITEVNPLSPHYYCPKCHYSDFESEEVRSYAGGCGFDMPDKRCPNCGAILVKAGFDIPFETFLGLRAIRSRILI